MSLFRPRAIGTLSKEYSFDLPVYNLRTVYEARRAYPGAGMLLLSAILPRQSGPRTDLAAYYVAAVDAAWLKDATQADFFKAQAPKFARGSLLEVALVFPDGEQFVETAQQAIAAARGAGVPLVLGVSIMHDPKKIALLASEEGICAVSVSQPVPWELQSAEIRKIFFRTVQSPIGDDAKTFLSGKYLLPLVLEFVGQLSRSGMMVPSIIRGGVVSPSGLARAQAGGCRGVVTDTLVSVRPWYAYIVHALARKLFNTKK
jgi:hypothetical protein